MVYGGPQATYSSCHLKVGGEVQNVLGKLVSKEDQGKMQGYVWILPWATHHTAGCLVIA